MLVDHQSVIKLLIISYDRFLNRKQEMMCLSIASHVAIFSWMSVPPKKLGGKLYLSFSQSARQFLSVLQSSDLQ